MAWQLEGEDRILAWLEGSSHAPTKDAVLAWVAHLLADPDAVPGIPVPGERLPVLVDNVPDTNVWITWLVVDQYRVVRIREVFEP